MDGFGRVDQLSATEKSYFPGNVSMDGLLSGQYPYGEAQIISRVNQGHKYFGPEIFFAKGIGAQTNHDVLIIKIAYGGMPLGCDDPQFSRCWLSPSMGGNQNPKSLFNQMIYGGSSVGSWLGIKGILSQKASYFTNVNLKSFIWMQGESDATNLGQSILYEVRLSAFIDDIRKDLNAPSLPFILAAISKTNWSFSENVTTAQTNVSSTKDNVYLLRTEGFSKWPVNSNPNDPESPAHYDTRGQKELGSFLAECAITPAQCATKSPWNDIVTRVGPAQVVQVGLNARTAIRDGAEEFYDCSSFNCALPLDAPFATIRQSDGSISLFNSLDLMQLQWEGARVSDFSMPYNAGLGVLRKSVPTRTFFMPYRSMSNSVGGVNSLKILMSNLYQSRYSIFLMNVYKISGQELLGFFHIEDNSPCIVEAGLTLDCRGTTSTTYSFGLGYSRDGGTSWNFLGEFLHPFYEGGVDIANKKNPGINSNPGGVPYVLVNGSVYVYYSETPNNNTVADKYLSVARANLSEVVKAARKGELASWQKYSGNGSWNEPAIGGLGANINPTIDDGFPQIWDVHGDAAYVASLNKYVLVLARNAMSLPTRNFLKEGAYLFTSDDGLNWNNWHHIYPSERVQGDDGIRWLTAPKYFSIIGTADGVSSDDFSTVGSEFYVLFGRTGISGLPANLTIESQATFSQSIKSEYFNPLMLHRADSSKVPFDISRIKIDLNKIGASQPAPSVIMSGINSQASAKVLGSQTIVLSGFPKDWTPASIAFQIESNDGKAMTGSVEFEGHTYSLTGWSSYYTAAYSGQAQITVTVHSGSLRGFRYKWWTSGQAVSSSSSSSSVVASSSSSVVTTSTCLCRTKCDVPRTLFETFNTKDEVCFKISNVSGWTAYNINGRVVTVNGIQISNGTQSNIGSRSNDSPSNDGYLYVWFGSGDLNYAGATGWK
jgi:hypothetical protein